MLRHTAASLLAQSGVPVTAAAASLGHDPAIFLRTYAHLYPGDLGAVADAMDAARSAVVDAQQQDDEGTSSVRAPSSGSELCCSELCGARGFRGDGQTPPPRGRVAWPLTCTFESGCRDLNPGPLDPQSSALTKLRHSPSLVEPLKLLQSPQPRGPFAHTLLTRHRE